MVSDRLAGTMPQVRPCSGCCPSGLVNALSPQVRCSGALLRFAVSSKLKGMRYLLLEQPLEVSLCTRAAGVVNSMQRTWGGAVQGDCLRFQMTQVAGGDDLNQGCKI